MRIQNESQPRSIMAAITVLSAFIKKGDGIALRILHGDNAAFAQHELIKKTNKIFLKRHLSEDKSILIEVGRSMHQERHVRNMPQTINYINKEIEQGYSEYACIPSRGMMLYEYNDKMAENFLMKYTTA
jgi:hypothetical protein